MMSGVRNPKLIVVAIGGRKTHFSMTPIMERIKSGERIFIFDVNNQYNGKEKIESPDIGERKENT